MMEYHGIFISKLCGELGLQYVGRDVKIDGLNIIGRSSLKQNILSYVTGSQYKKKVLTDKKIKAVIVPKDTAAEYLEIMENRTGCLVISDTPEKTFYQIHDYLMSRGDFYEPVVKDTIISGDVVIHPTALIEEHVIIEAGVKIGAFSMICHGSIIRANSVIGNHTIVGAEGYQVLEIDGVPTKMKHCGGVLIDENVEIGDHCTVCNTLFEGFTRIGAHSKIDNHCHIAHYSDIGKNVVITPGVTIVGSVTIEDNCYIGAGATIMNRAVIHRAAKVGIGSVVLHSVKEGVTVMGNPAKQIF